MYYKVIYHIGEEIGIKTRVLMGTAEIADRSLILKDDGAVSIIKNVRSVEMFRLHGTGRMIRVIHSEGTLFLAVVRFCLWGYFSMINFFGTGRLYSELSALVERGNIA